MMFQRTHLSPAYRPLEAAWQGCVVVAVPKGLDRSRPRASKKGFGVLDSQANYRAHSPVIGAISTELTLGLAPEVGT